MKKKSFLVLLAAVVLCAVLTAVGCTDSLFTVKLNYDETKGTVTYDEGTDLSAIKSGTKISFNVTPKDGFTVSAAEIDGEPAEIIDGKLSFELTVTKNSEINITFAATTTVADKGIILKESDKCELILPTPANGGTRYAEGETVTAQVISKDGYLVTALKIGEQTVSVRNGYATFTMGAEDMTVTPVYQLVMTEKMFENLKKPMKVSGEYVQDIIDSDEDNSASIVTVFETEKIWQKEYDPSTGSEYSNYVYGKSGDYLTVFERTLDNSVVENVYSDLYADYANPFIRLQGKDLKLIEEGVYGFINMDAAKKAATALTGWVEAIESFTIKLTDGVLTEIHIKTQEIALNETENYVVTYDFDVTEVGTAVIPEEEYTPYVKTAEHEILENALAAAQAAEKYTVRHRGHELNVSDENIGQEGYKDTDYNVYVVRGDIIYDSYKGEENGYKVLNGNVYPFYVVTVDNTLTVTIKDPVNAKMEDLTSTFTGFKAEFFKYAGKTEDNRDIFTIQKDAYSPYFAPFFGEGADEQKYYAYAKKLAIYIKDGVLDEVKLTTATYGISEEITLNYDFTADFTEVLNTLDFENASKDSVLDPFKGDYKDDNGNFCKADSSGFILNGEAVENLSYSSATETQPATFTGVWRGKTIYIMKWSSLQLFIQSEDLTVSWTLTSIDSVTTQIPASYKGIWSINNPDEQLVYEFRIQTYAIWCNGEEMTVLSYTDDAGISAVLNGVNFNFMLAEDSDDGSTFIKMLLTFEDSSYVTFGVEQTSANAGIEIPSDYVGIYTDDNYDRKVVITYSQITVNGEEFKITSYSAANGFIGTLGEVTDYGISFYYDSKDKLVIGTAQENYVLERRQSLNEHYIGAWKNSIPPEEQTDKDHPYSYFFVITDTTITMTADYYVLVNGEYIHYSFENRVLDCTFGEYGYAFQLEGSNFTTYILARPNAYGNMIMTMYDDNALMIMFEKTELKIVPQDYVGAWRGTADEKVYEAVIAADGTVNGTFNGVAVTVTNAKYNSQDNRLEFVANGVNYFLIFKTDANGNYVNLYSIGGAVDVNLNRVAKLDLPETLYGEWISSAASTIKAEMVISETEFSVKIGDGEFVSVDFVEKHEVSGYVTYTFTLNETEYEIETSYGDGSFMISTADGWAMMSKKPAQA